MTVMSADPLPQHLSALGRANTVRLGRARVKGDLKNFKVRFTWAVDHEYTQTMTAFDLLCALPRSGPVYARKVLRKMDATEATIVGKLSQRQRQIMVSMVDTRYGGRL